MTTRNIVSLTVPDDVFAAALEDYCAAFSYRAQIVDPDWKAPAEIKPGDPLPQPRMIENPETKWAFVQRTASERFIADVIAAANARAHRTALAEQQAITAEMKARVTIQIDQ